MKTTCANSCRRTAHADLYINRTLATPVLLICKRNRHRVSFLFAEKYSFSRINPNNEDRGALRRSSFIRLACIFSCVSPFLPLFLSLSFGHSFSSSRSSLRPVRRETFAIEFRENVGN